MNRNDGRPVRAIVPGQQVSGKPIGERQQQQHYAHHPRGFARFFIRAPEKHLPHMEHHHDDHQARAPVMQASNHLAAGQFGNDVAKAVIRLTRSRRVVQREQNSGGDLHQKCEHRHAAQNLMPARGVRNILVQKMIYRGLDAGTFFEPVDNAPQQFHAF